VALPRSAPSAVGVEPAAVDAFLDAVEADPEVELHGFVLVRHGSVAAEGWWAPYTADRPQLLYSLSKSVTSTALGLAIADGLLDLDDTVLSHYPELDAAVTDPRSRATTLRDLATMSSGHTRELWPEVVERYADDPVRGLLLTPPDVEPGTVFTYSQPCTYALADVVQRRAGRTLTDYLRPRVLDPLGIGPVTWQSWPEGGPEIGFSGLFARTGDVAALGQLWLGRGRWGEEQLLPAAYVDAATSRQIATPAEGAVHWTRGYGYHFWRSADGYRGDGAFGQYCVVLPEHDAVVAITSSSASMSAVLSHVWRHLLPGLGAVRPGTPADDALLRRLRALALPPVTGARRPYPAGRWPVDGEPFTVVEVAGDTLALSTGTDGGTPLRLPLGVGAWRTSEPRDHAGHAVPVAASAAWLDDDTVRADVVFLETPHRLQVTIHPSAGRAVAVWRLALGPGLELHELHQP
jgi:CubicO group peptidase (beta-lactamase class C family)